jgi:hypothetical protein
MGGPVTQSGVAQFIADPNFPQRVLTVNPDGSITIRGAPFSYTPRGYEQIVNPAPASLTVPPGATMALIAVSGGSARWRDDGTPPDPLTGMPLAAGQEFQYSGNLAAIQFFGAAATLDVSFYQ